MKTDTAYSFGEIQILSNLQMFLSTALRREYLKTIKYKATEEAVLFYLATNDTKTKSNLIHCLKDLEGYDSLEIMRIFQFLNKQMIMSVDELFDYKPC